MKKVLSFAAVIILILTVYFCFFDDNEPQGVSTDAVREQIESREDVYPVYKNLSAEDKELYIKICAAVQSFANNVPGIYECDSMSKMNQYINRLSNIYREIIYEQATLFWVDPYNFQTQITQRGNGTYYLTIQPVYLMDQQTAETMQVKFDRKMRNIVNEAARQENTFEKVRYVHDQLLKNCVYDQAAYEAGDFKSTSINAYGCLVEGKAICSGYTMAFSAIMQELGYECGAEFNSYDSFTIFNEGHVWNYCKLDGDYYYFDLTWNDNAPNSDLYKYYDYCYTYFGLTTQELTNAHLTLSGKANTPSCNGTKYNYFVYNGLSFASYEEETVKQALLKQKDGKYAALRFDSYAETLRAQRELITNGKIFDIFPNLERIEYYISQSDLVLYILFSQ